MLETEKKEYEKPTVEVVEVLEQTALSCLSIVCSNPWYTSKESCSYCGFAYS